MILTVENNQMLCVYNGRTKTSKNKRMVFIDYLDVTKDGSLKVTGPTIHNIIPE